MGVSPRLQTSLLGLRGGLVPGEGCSGGRWGHGARQGSGHGSGLVGTGVGTRLGTRLGTPWLCARLQLRCVPASPRSPPARGASGAAKRLGAGPGHGRGRPRPPPRGHEWVLGPSGLVPAAVGQPEAGAGAHRTGGTTAPCSRVARRGDADSRGFRLKNPHFPTPCSWRRLAACAHEGGSQVTGSFIPRDVQPVLKLAAPRQPPHRPAARFPSAQGQHM